jgi:hypothetical protein
VDKSHDWHLIDAPQELECRMLEDGRVFIRKIGRSRIVELTRDQFDSWREGGDVTQLKVWESEEQA